MGKKRNKKPSEEKMKRKEKLKEKEYKIRSSKNKIVISEDLVHEVMGEFHVVDYRMELWDEIRLKSNHGSWIIRWDEEVIFLWHGSETSIRFGNDRSSYHLQNVFYDLHFCVKSIVEHDMYKLQSTR